MKKGVLTVIVILIFTVIIVMVSSFTPYEDGDSEGQITIFVVDETGTRVYEDTFTFYEEDTLFGILDAYYTVHYEEMAFDLWDGASLRFNRVSSKVILGINEVNTDFSTQFLKISIRRPIYEDGHLVDYDEKPAQTGIDGIPLYDGATYTFTVERVRKGGES